MLEFIPALKQQGFLLGEPVMQVIEAMAAEEAQSVQQPSQPDQGIVQQTDQTMVPPSG